MRVGRLVSGPWIGREVRVCFRRTGGVVDNRRVPRSAGRGALSHTNTVYTYTCIYI